VWAVVLQVPTVLAPPAVQSALVQQAVDAMQAPEHMLKPVAQG
jgi:hypothetical protein